MKHRRYFQIAGVTIHLESDLDFKRIKFKDELTAFAVHGPGRENALIRHYFQMPDLKGKNLGKELYRTPPWAISQKKRSWIYQGISQKEGGETGLHQLAFFNTDHSRASIFNPPYMKELIYSYGWQSLSLMPTDQIWLSPLLSNRNAVLLHSAAAIVNGQGLVFVGHSEAGKSTTLELLKKEGYGRGIDTEILCDDRNVIRKWPEGWRVHGTWSHGDISDVSPNQASLRGILFLEKATRNEIVPLADRKQIWARLLATLIRPLVTADWWQKKLNTLELLVQEPCYIMRFNKSGAIVPELERLTRET